MELTDYVKVLQRQWRIVTAVTLAIVLFTAIVTAVTPRTYRAQAQIFVSTASGDSLADLAQGSNFTQRQIVTYADIIMTPIVLNPVAEQLGLTTNSELASSITAEVPVGTVLIDLNVTHGDPVAAAEIANAVAQQFAQTIQELERVEETQPSPVKATVVQPADVPISPDAPIPGRDILLGAVFGLLIGLGAGFLLDFLDKRVRGEPDVARVTDRPTLGAMAFDRDAPDHPLVIEIDPHSPRAEAFRALRTNLLYLDPDDQPRVILVTSSVPGEGKSTTTANLALTIAETGSTVCLIEGDLRRPRLLGYMGLENAVGLTDVLVERAEVEDVLQPHVQNLQVLGCGPIPPNPSELLGSAAMERLLRELSKEYDYVLIDAPPLLAVTDAAVLSTLTDGAIVVVGAGVVKRDELKRGLANLERVDGRVLGLVANRLPAKGPDAYHYSYESYRPDDPAQDGGKRTGSRWPRRHAPKTSAND